MIHVMLPVQYLRAPGESLSEPHRRLMAAVLQAVVDDCRGGSSYRRIAHENSSIDARSMRDAIAYVASTDRAWPFSFENVCDALGINSADVRVALDVRRAPSRSHDAAITPLRRDGAWRR